MFSPVTNEIDRLTRFAEALAKLEPEERMVFVEALDRIIHPAVHVSDMGQIC